jgi:hypothetical protein
MKRLVTFGVWLAVTSAFGAEISSPVLWKDNDSLPIAEPAEDAEGDYVVWDGVRNMFFYPLGKLLDVGELARTIGVWAHVVSRREAANVNALDEVPDSTWFTNRHGRNRLSAPRLARGPNTDHAPAEDGPLVVLSGKSLGMTPGLVVRDRKGDRYVVKFDPPLYPELATGAELVCSKIVWALGWNVPEYYLITFSEERLSLAPDATVKDSWGRTVPLSPDVLRRLLRRSYHLPDGRIRALASRTVPGVPKGSPSLLGVRPDDPNDTVPHEDRRELRGLRTVAAFISFTDARRGNFLDTFVPDSAEPGSGGHLVHYVLDFSSGLGAGNVDYKDRKLGNEYLFDPPKVLFRALTLWQIEPDWARLPLTHPALGYFESSIFDPERWRPSYLNPLFDHATLRDSFWGAQLVTSLRDQDLRIISRAGGWSDPHVADLLSEILVERRDRIARAYFDWRRIDPIGVPDVRGSTLTFRDLAVEAGIVEASAARYRHRVRGGDWVLDSGPVVTLPDSASTVVLELETSHDAGERWSPPARITLTPSNGGGLQATELRRETR